MLPWILHSDTWGSVVNGYGQSRLWWYVTEYDMSGGLGLTQMMQGNFHPGIDVQ